MERKVYKLLFNDTLDKFMFFQIKYLFNKGYSVTYYPTIKAIEIFNRKTNIGSRYYERVNKTAIINFSAHLINLFLLTKTYYESNN